MTPHKAAFDMYEVIPTRNVHMSDDSIVEAIRMGSILAFREQNLVKWVQSAIQHE